MELTAIVTGLLLAIGALTGLTGLVLHAWTAGRRQRRELGRWHEALPQADSAEDLVLDGTFDADVVDAM